MKPLLWKELRNLSACVVIGLAIVGAFRLLCFSGSFEELFLNVYWSGGMPFAITCLAVGIGVVQVARERHAKTLDYLLIRPVATGSIVWAKFVAGSFALSVLVVALVWLGFIDSKYGDSDTFTLLRGNVGVLKASAILFPRFWCLYAIALFSLRPGRPLREGGGGDRLLRDQCYVRFRQACMTPPEEN